MVQVSVRVYSTAVLSANFISQKWKDYKIISVDGSAAFLVNNVEFQQYYKGGTNQFGGYALAVI